MNLDLFGVGIKSRSETMTAQRRVNVYYESVPDEDSRKSKITVLGTPGLSLFTDFGGSPNRLEYPKGDLLYVINRGTFYEVNRAGAITARGTLDTTSGRCYAADNGTQIMVSDGLNGYIYTIATAILAQITDPGFPGCLNVTWQDGFFIVPKPDSGRWHISASYDGTSWDALDFKDAESEPDSNLFALSHGGTLMIFGTASTEFWGNTGGSAFPFTRIQGASLKWGLAAKDSVAKYDNSVVALMRNDMGQLKVAKITGLNAEPISTPDLESILKSFGTVADATALSYTTHDGHPMYQLNLPTGNRSWLYDGKASSQMGYPVWSEVSSGTGRHRADAHASFFDRSIVADYENGKLYILDPDVYSDNGAAIRRLLVSKHMTNEGNPLTVDEIRLVFETGVGLASGQGEDPQIMLRYSKDGGRTWSPERRRTLGAIGKTRSLVAFSRFGQAEDLVFEIAMTDPVKFVLVAEAIEAEAHAWA